MRKTTQKEDKRQGIDKNENRDMIEAVAALAKEKNISKELLFSAIEEALKSAYKIISARNTACRLPTRTCAWS